MILNMLRVNGVLLSAMLLILLFAGCRKKGFIGVDEKFARNSIQEHRMLQGTKLDLGMLLSPIQLFFHDSLLFVTTTGLPLNVLVFDQKHNYKSLGSILPTGMGPDELLSVARMDFNADHSFWAHDVITGKLKKYQLQLQKDTIYTDTEFTVNLPLSINTFCLNNGIIGSTTRDIIPLTRFYVYDSLGNRIKETGDYPAYDREIPPTAMVEVYNGWVGLHPSKSKFVMVYEITDLIEFYDNTFQLLKRVQGPDDFLPEFKVKQRGLHPALVRKFDLTRFAYQAVVTGENMIFLLYDNGETISRDDDPEEAAHFKTIVVIDWDGKPLALFELDHAVISIAVDWKMRIIFGLNRIESEVYAFPF
jgi:hypothetical protein